MMVRRQTAIIFVAALVLAAWDFFGRVYVGRDATLRGFEPPALSPLVPRPDAQAVRNSLAGWLPGLRGTQIVAADASDPAGWDFTLLGVFGRGSDRFAVVQARSRAGGATETLQVKEGDELRGAKVTEVGRKRLVLQDGASGREIPLFEYGGSPIEPVAINGAGPANTRPETAQATAVAPPVPATKAAGASAASADPETRPGGSGARRVSEAQQLQPGEEVKLPWNLPVVEEGAQPPARKPQEPRP